MVVALVQLGAPTVAASEAIDAWLALPPRARQSACADLLKRAKSADDRWGQAYLQQTQIADGTTRLRLIDTALAARPAADVEPWFQLARSQALIVSSSGIAALEVAIPLTEDGNPRVRYEASLLAAEALGLSQRTDEARAQLRTAEDLARPSSTQTQASTPRSPPVDMM